MIKLKHKIILGSQSPRRKQLLSELGLQFEIRTKDIPEEYPSHLKGERIAIYLAELKANSLKETLTEKELLITADTIVLVQERMLAKPANSAEATEMLTLLSGQMHEVFTGVCLLSLEKKSTFVVRTKVYFRTLTPEEIEYYIRQFKPYDKAGAYGAQDWLGLVGIEKIEGSYFNVMGLPTKELYEHLIKF